jgi:hypothetical protein
LVLRTKPRNRHSNFEAQITKTELLVLRPKSENRPPPWFWDSTKKLTIGFKAKSGETVATSFEAKLEKTVATGFEAKQEKTITTGFDTKSPETDAAGFEAKPLETVRVVLRSNHSQTVAISFEAQTDEKSSELFWGRITHKLSTLVFRLNQETCAPHLHVHVALCIQHHPTSRPPDHLVSDLCDHP